MKNIGLFEAKQKLSELMERARGERIGITRHGELAAYAPLDRKLEESAVKAGVQLLQ